jgi:hypothetical protein
MHETGHLLGLEHDAGGVMAEALRAGTRTAPAGDAQWLGAPTFTTGDGWAGWVDPSNPWYDRRR